MALSTQLLKNLVNQSMPTKETIQSDVWQSLESIGFKEHGIEGFPDIKDLADKISERLWQHTKDVSDILCEKIVSHIVSNAVVTTTVQVVTACGSGPGSGSGSGTGTVS